MTSSFFGYIKLVATEDHFSHAAAEDLVKKVMHCFQVFTICYLVCMCIVSMFGRILVYVYAYRRLHVRFNHRVTVYELDDLDEERCSHWMYVAARRLHFQHRIRQTAVILEPILTEEHRLLMWLRTMRLSD